MKKSQTKIRKRRLSKFSARSRLLRWGGNDRSSPSLAGVGPRSALA